MNPLMKVSLGITWAVLFLAMAGCRPSEPGPEPPGDEGPVVENPDQEYIGQTKAEAEALAKKQERVWRIVQEDGKNFPVTMDYQPERLNFTVEKGKVVSVSRG